MSGMIPSIWGPMTWRQIHGMAHIFDTRDVVYTPYEMQLFILFLLRLAWVLPCVYCRKSYTDFASAYLELNTTGEMKIMKYFETRNVRILTFDLHNQVNAKLDKDTKDLTFELVKRRSIVWSVEFLASELLGLLFIIALNFSSNSEPNKETHYKEFFHVLPALCLMLGDLLLAAALEKANVSNLQTFNQETLVNALYFGAYVPWLKAGNAQQIPSLENIIDRYTLCKSA